MNYFGFLRACLKNARGFAAGLLPGAFVGSDLTARFGDARSSPPRLRPKSLAAKPLAFFRHALTLCAVVLQLFAAPNARAEGDNQVLAQWVQTQSAIRTFTADFKQTRELKALTEPLVATGKIYIAAPDRFRWEILQPAPTIAVRDHDNLLVIFPKLKRAEKYSLANLKKGPWKDLMGLLDTGFPRSQAEFDERFHLRNVTPIDGGQRLDIEPTSALVKKYMPQLTIDIATPGFGLLATSMQFVDGSAVKNAFTHPRINPDLDDALFHPQLGPDYKITEPLAHHE